MTLHTAKGLEFRSCSSPVSEDGIFPHMRAMTDPKELEEERRLAYVGITRARKRLYLTRATVRVMWASSNNPPSRFIEEIPERPIDWRRARGVRGASGPHGGVLAADGRVRRVGEAGRSSGGVRERRLRVLHTKFGLGSVIETSGWPTT